MNIKGKKTRKIASFYLAIILVAGALFGFFAGISGAETVSASILAGETTDRKDEITTAGGNKAWELVVDVKVSVDTAGEYVLSGDMRPSGIQSSAIVKSHLSTGEHVLRLKFAGSNIFYYQVDGNYKIQLILEMENAIEVLDQKLYTTIGIYDHRDFKPVDTGLSDFTLALESFTVKLKTDVLTAIIYEKTPVIEYYFTADSNEAMFRVSYTRLVGYSDANGDGKFNDGDIEVYSADLMEAVWDSNKALFENFASFIFDITTVVTMESPQNPNVDVELKFHYSSASYISNEQRKFDIEILIPDGQTLLGVDAIAIEHVIEDISASDNRHDISFDDTLNTLSFVDEDDNPHGYYSWLGTADSHNVGDIAVGASTTDTSGGMTLYLSYAYDESVVRIFHDPVIGIDPDNIKEDFIKTIDKILHHPAVYIISVLIAAGIVFGSLFKGKRK